MELWRKSLGYALGRGFASLVVLIIMPILTRLMPPDEFGLWQALAFWAALVAVVVQLGSDQALFRFYITGAGERGRFLFAAFAFWAFASSALVLVVFAARGFLARLLFGAPELGWLVFGTALWGVSDALFQLVGAFFQAQERVGAFVACDIARATMGYGLALLLLARGLGVFGVVASWVAAGFAVAFAVAPEILRRWQANLDRRVFAPMVRYGFPLAVNMLAVRVFSFADRWLLARLGSLSAAGAYSAAVRIAGVVAMVLVPVRYAWTARMFHMYKSGTLRAQLPHLWRQLAGGMAVVASAVAILSREFFSLMVGPGYEVGARVVPIIAAAFFIDALVLIADAGVYVTGRTVIIPVYTAFAAAANIALNVILIPRYGVFGAAFASVVAYALLLFLLWRAGQMLFPVDVPYAAVFAACLAVVASVVVALQVEGVVPRCVAFAVIAAATTVACRIDRDVAKALKGGGDGR